MTMRARIRRLELLDGGLKPLPREGGETSAAYWRRVVAAPLPVRKISLTGPYKPRCVWDWARLEHVPIPDS